MRTTERERIARILVEDAPQPIALRLLGHIIKVTTGARGAAVFGFRSGNMYAFADRTITDRHILAAQVWGRDAEQLRAGRAIDERGCSLTPLFVSGRLVGLLLVDGVEASRVELQEIGPALAAAVDFVPRPEEDEGTSLTVDEHRREHVLAVLEKREWNLAGAARDLGVTRRTLYLWLNRWGIPRQRVRKTPRPRLATSEG